MEQISSHSLQFRKGSEKERNYRVWHQVRKPNWFLLVLKSLLPASSALIKNELCCTPGKHCSSEDNPNHTDNLNTSNKNDKHSHHVNYFCLHGLQGNILYFINSQTHFYLTVTAKSHHPPPRLYCSCRNGQSPHTLIFVSHSLSWCLRSLRNCHIYKSEYFVKTLNMHSVWWFCVFGPRGWEPKNIKGLFLRCLQKVMKKQWSQQAWSYSADSSTWMTPQVKDLTAKYSQTLPFRAKSLSCTNSSSAISSVTSSEQHSLSRKCRLIRL